MFDSPRRRHMYDLHRPQQSVRRIWQGPGFYHVILIQSGNKDWIGYWSSNQLGKIPNKGALAEFLDYATHVVDNARKVGMIGDLPVIIYAFHEAQMGDHRRMLGIPDVNSDDGSWMRIRHRHPFVPVSYTRMESFDEFGEMNFSDMSQDLQDYVAEMDRLGHEQASVADLDLGVNEGGRPGDQPVDVRRVTGGDHSADENDAEDDATDSARDIPEASDVASDDAEAEPGEKE